MPPLRRGRVSASAGGRRGPCRSVRRRREAVAAVGLEPRDAGPRRHVEHARTSPVSGSIRRSSLSSSSQVPCHSSPSTQVTPVTKRFDSMVRRIAPVSGSTWWILRARYCPTQSVPSAQASPESPPPPGAGMVASTRPVSGSIFWMRSSAIWNRCRPSKAVPAWAGDVDARAATVAAVRIEGVQPVAGRRTRRAGRRR